MLDTWFRKKCTFIFEIIYYNHHNTCGHTIILVLVKFQYYRLHWKMPFFNIAISWPNSKVNLLFRSNYRITENCVSKMLSLLLIFTDNFHQNGYIETLISKIPHHWCWKSSYCNSSYWNINIKNMSPPNHIEPQIPKFHIEPALHYTMVSYFKLHTPIIH